MSRKAQAYKTALAENYLATMVPTGVQLQDSEGRPLDVVSTLLPILGPQVIGAYIMLQQMHLRDLPQMQEIALAVRRQYFIPPETNQLPQNLSPQRRK